MPQRWLPWLPLLAGLASALQAATNSAMALRVGLAATLVINAVGTLVFIAPYAALQGWQKPVFGSGAPWYLFLGGFYGFVIITLLALAFVRLGGAVTISLFVLGQGAMALMVDHFGLLGQPRDPLTLSRGAGIALVVAGVALLRWR